MADTPEPTNHYGNQDSWEEYSKEELRVALADIVPAVLRSRRAGVAKSESPDGASE